MLIGRNAEKSAVADLLDSARLGRSRTLILRGPPGIGKTALLDLASVSAEGMEVMRLSAVVTERDIAFAGLYELLYPLLPRLREIPDPQRAALEGALALAAPTPTDRFAVAAATLSLLGLAAGSRPLLILIDDAHWLDLASAEALAFTARRLDREGIAMLAATSDPESRPLSSFPSLTLQPMSPQDCSRLLQLRSGVVPTPAVADRILAESGGIPLAIVAAAGLLSPAQLDGSEPLPIPLPVAADMVGRLLDETDPMSATARGLLVSVAAADTRSIRVLSRVPGADGFDALADAERQGLLVVHGEQIGFANPLMRSALYQAASPEERRLAHARIAAALVEPRYRDRRAVHLGKAATQPDDEVAAELEWAGDRYRERVGYGVAAAAYRRAAELSEQEHDRCRRLWLAASAAWQAGRPAESSELLDRIGEPVSDPLLAADVEYLRARIEIRQGGAVDVDEVLETAAKLSGLDPARAARMLIAAAERAAPARQIELLTRACDLSREADHAVWLRASLARSGAIADAGDGEQATQLAHDLRAGLAADAGLRAEPELLVLAAAATGEAEPDLELSAQAVSSARERGAVAVLPHALFLWARAAEARGSWDDALAALTDAEQLAEASGQERWRGRTIAARAWIHAVRGDEARSTAELERLVELDWPPAQRLALVETCIGLIRLAGGDAAAAAQHLATRLEMPGPPSAVDNRRWLIPDLVEALVHLGQSDDAAALMAAQADSPSGMGWLQARLAAAAAIVSGDDDAFAEAAGMAEQLTPPHPYHRARVELAHGQHLRRRGRISASRPPLRSAIELFDALGAAAWAERARGELGATNEHPSAPDPANRDRLTPQERLIADLVVSGLTDSEVAARLFLSAKTISYHLDKVYKKLSCTPGRGRRELAAKLRELDDEGGA